MSCHEAPGPRESRQGRGEGKPAALVALSSVGGWRHWLGRIKPSEGGAPLALLCWQPQYARRTKAICAEADADVNMLSQRRRRLATQQLGRLCEETRLGTPRKAGDNRAADTIRHHCPLGAYYEPAASWAACLISPFENAEGKLFRRPPVPRWGGCGPRNIAHGRRPLSGAAIRRI